MTYREMDPIVFAVLFSRFAGIGREMSLTMERTARSTILNEGKDFSCSIFDSKARVITQEEEVLPIHTTAGGIVLKEIIKDFSGDINPGDIMICNDPYRGNSHVADLTMAGPVFYQNELIFWAVTRAHHIDIGSPIPSAVRADAPDVFSEGLKIPPVRIARDYRVIKDVMSLYKVNVRFPEVIHGDLLAQIASARLGEKRLKEVCEEYGIDTVKAYIDEVIDYSDRRMGEEISKWLDGIYQAAGYSDSDGVGNEDILVKCKVIIEKDTITVNLSGSQNQTRGSTNSSWGNTQAQVNTAILACIDPTIPRNEGCLKHIRVIAPEGTVVNPTWPTATSNCTVVIGDTICLTLWKALAKAIPRQVPAGWGKQSPTNLMLSGIDDRTGEWYGYQTFKASSGGGGIWGHDGWSTILTATTLGGTRCQGVEAEELCCPHSIEKYEIWPDSAGAGKYRGGFGSMLVFRARKNDLKAVFFGDGFKYPPHGILGGKSGRSGTHYVLNKTTGKKTVYKASGQFTLHKDEVYVGFASGGGGVGDPVERDAELVMEEARDGLISLRSAKQDYGVVLDPESFQIDYEATEKLRKKMKEQ